MPKQFSNRFFKNTGVSLGSALVACLILGSGVCAAGDDHDRARQALEAGQVLPLKTILDRVEREFPGQVVDVELEREHDSGGERWIYEVKVLRAGGTLVKLKVDARDGVILGWKNRHGAEGGKSRSAAPERGEGR